MTPLAFVLHLPREQLILLVPALLLSLTVHEFAHARTALGFGDRTAQQMGRVTLNPLAHLDFFGTLMLLFVGFGWAKPVPVNPMNLHPRRMGEILVSLAGPASNLVMAVASGFAARIILSTSLRGAPMGQTIVQALLVLMSINVLLCVFNLVPLFPLDGHHILREHLPARAKEGFMRWQVTYGRFVLLGMLLVPRLLNRPEGPSIPDPLGMLFRTAHAGLASLIFTR